MVKSDKSTKKKHYGEQKEKSKVDFQPYSHLVAGSRIELETSGL